MRLFLLELRDRQDRQYGLSSSGSLGGKLLSPNMDCWETKASLMSNNMDLCKFSHVHGPTGSHLESQLGNAPFCQLQAIDCGGILTKRN